jgi:hypothetical protein
MKMNRQQRRAAGKARQSTRTVVDGAAKVLHDLGLLEEVLDANGGWLWRVTEKGMTTSLVELEAMQLEHFKNAHPEATDADIAEWIKQSEQRIKELSDVMK